MRIGVDLDGTVADNLELLVEAMNRHSGKVLCGQDIPQYNLCKVYSMSETDFFKIMVTEEPRIIETSPVIPLARENLERLAREGWEIHIITARSPKYGEITKQWLENNRIPFHKLHLLNSHNKLATCKQLKVEMIVEDNVHNAYQLSEGGIRVLLFDAPHNRNWEWQGIRCKSWDEIYENIKENKK